MAVDTKNWRSQRLGRLGSSIFSEVAGWKREAIAEGQSIIDLGIGSPDQPPQMAIREVLSESALQADKYAYPVTKNDLPFRQVAADWMQHRFAVSLDPADEIVALSGSQDGLAHLALAICDTGDAALIPDPGYPIYAASLALAGVEPIMIPLTAEHQFLPNLEDIREEEWNRATFILLNYPNNPLSAVANITFFEQLVAKAKQYQLLIVHDLAYSELVFDGYEPPSILQVAGAKEIAVEFHSLSKSFNMAGCRIGFLAGNRAVVQALSELKANIDYGIFEPVQDAAIVALQRAMQQPKTETVGKLYERRRDVFLQALLEEGWYIEPPKATMFIWAPLPEVDWIYEEPYNSVTFTQQLMKRAGVAVIPGIAFGNSGEGYVRIGLVESEENLLLAAKRIGMFIRGE
ncbi:aminotransferase class I/II-fold pyridoxal phosphate-dependent enzyme [Paenibacillus yanchengensis]|uniref:Aminotransferase n=1 Tax=Paenibacillus yanchengensis TaxID=2035833 RepID=A0ABW4YLM0_9BACL